MLAAGVIPLKSVAEPSTARPEPGNRRPYPTASLESPGCGARTRVSLIPRGSRMRCCTKSS